MEYFLGTFVKCFLGGVGVIVSMVAAGLYYGDSGLLWAALYTSPFAVLIPAFFAALDWLMCTAIEGDMSDPLKGFDNYDEYNDYQ